MKFCNLLLSSACATLVLASLGKAEPIASFTTGVSTASNTEMGRPSRSSIPQDWTGTEKYTGVLLTGNTYFYNTYRFTSSDFAGAPYVEITDFEPNNTSNYFLAAYAGSYDVNNRGANWLGDAGFSGNAISGDGGDFQVVLPSGQDLLLVLNSVIPGSAPGTSIQIALNAYADTMYDDPSVLPTTVTPEPSSFVLLGTGLAGALAATRRRFRFAV